MTDTRLHGRNQHGQDTTSSPPSSNGLTAGLLVTGLCWGVMLLEGYDVISLGTVMPVLLDDSSLGFTPGITGWVAAAVFAGALVGALASGNLSDRFGRRPLVIAAVTVFSVFTALCALAVGPISLGILRLFAGLGLGALIPTTSALTLEYAPARRRTLFYTMMLSGVPFGGVIAALVALPVLPNLGWHWMFLFGAIPGILVLPLLVKVLPESATFLRSIGRTRDADVLADRFGLPADASTDTSVSDEEPEERGIFAPGYVLASALFAITTFCGLFAWYGLATWLPSIMTESGYALDSSLVFLLVLNLGAVAGSLFTATATDRWGNKPIVVGTYLMMTAALLLLSIKLDQVWLLVLIAVAGVGGHSGQILINAFVSRSYPASHRARALGWSLGAGRSGTIVGPVVIGWIVGGTSPVMGFVVFALMAVIAAGLLAIVPRTAAFRGARGVTT